jgi:hypothetical protein
MKYLIFIITFFGFTTSLFSQDSIKVRTEIDTFKQSNYEGQFDYVFSRKEPKKQLFKLGGLINSNNSFFELAYERKLTKDISANVSLINSIEGDVISSLSNALKISEYGSFLNSVIKVGIEPRWYYSMRKDIKKGLISDNLNGNYIGLRTYFDYDEVSGIPELNSYNISHELTWGIQRRILRNQYLNFNIGAGYYYRSNNLTSANSGTRDPDKWIFNYRFTYGLILDKNLFKKKQINCDALRCFEEEKSLWKIGISNALAAIEQSFVSQLSIAKERKIRNSQWSVETKLDLSAAAFKDKWVEGQIYNAKLQIMPRFYWDLNKRIAKGESANNLSGKYLGLIVNYGVGKFKSYQIPTNPIGYPNFDITLKSAAIVPVIGFQKRLLNHLYIDANTGYGAIYSELNVSKRWRCELSANFTFGLSF